MNPRADAVGTVFETYVQANKNPAATARAAARASSSRQQEGDL
eukprot:CAMPEP_0185744116 /NCGR_PEP_ID=MMETSP1174-20130828/2133_1 /TAXON_ID=35687 /ORGANISM="Dictyocha speculum, Strain CCMP1381" /LENGTH=42 /DNA_ID= /DNA_START= /DNA_END= /DNA_ORIENTATION=